MLPHIHRDAGELPNPLWDAYDLRIKYRQVPGLRGEPLMLSIPTILTWGVGRPTRERKGGRLDKAGLCHTSVKESVAHA